MSKGLKYIFPIKLGQLIMKEYTMDHEGNNTVRFGRFSPAGQDFSINVDMGENLYDLMQNLAEAYQNYDVSYEAYIWLDSTGHGANGAPYDMKDVYEDMETCREYIDELGELISDYMNEQDCGEQAAELLVSPEMH